MRGADLRGLALEVLVRIEGGAASDRALDRALRRRRLDDRDRRLATELVYGVLRRRRSLDDLLTPRSARPLESLDAVVRCGLRLGAYQLVFLDQVPAHAAVAATVEAVKQRNRAAAGYVNGVLRALQRAAGPRPAPGSGSLAERCELPDWWADRWVRRHGEARAAGWFEATLRPAPLALRSRGPAPAALAERLRREGVETEPSPLVPGALRVSSGNPLATDAFREGAFELRGEASQLVVGCLPVADGPVLDACCGRGGKGLQIAADHGVRVVGVDLARWRAAACRRAATRAGLDVQPLVADLTRGLPLRRTFPSILVDAPCSGLGTVRRRPEIKWRVTPERLARLATLQQRILASAAAALAPGGHLLYATCSTEPEENEAVVDAVVAADDELARAPISRGAVGDAALLDDGFLRTYPGFPDLDGFFAALLVRRNTPADGV